MSIKIGADVLFSVSSLYVQCAPKGQRGFTILTQHAQVLRSIDCALRLLADLREHLNDFAPVNRLPPEMLSHIFSIQRPLGNREVFRLNYPIQCDDYKSHQWRRLFTRVCRRWRAIGLGTPEAWSHVHVSSYSARFREYLARSKDHPLSISFGSPFPNLREVLGSIGPRLRRVDLTITSPHIDAVSPSVLGFDAPNLQCATFTCCRDELLADYGGLGHSPETQWVEIFGQRHSPLRALALSLATNWLPSNIFAHLTHLTLDFSKYITRSSSLGLLTLLGNTPKLEFFHIVRLSYDLSIADDSSAAQVKLDYLRSLVFDVCCPASLRLFLAQLIIPDGIPITLSEIGRMKRVNIVAPLLDHRSPVTSLEVNSQSVRLQVIASSPSRDFLLQWRSNRRRWFTIAPELFSLSTVTALKVGLERDSLCRPDRLFAHLPHVSEVEIYYRVPSTPVRPLKVASFGICPALSLFTLSIDFNGPHHPSEDPVLCNLSESLHQCSGGSASLRRVVVQPHAGSRAFTSREIEEIQSWFVQHSERLEIRNVAVPAFQSNTRKRWIVEGSEKYWDVYSAVKPRYIGPFREDLSAHWAEC